MLTTPETATGDAPDTKELAALSEAATGWLPHELGAPMPVVGETIVDILFAGLGEKRHVAASKWDWDETGIGAVTFWRLSEQHAAEQALSAYRSGDLVPRAEVDRARAEGEAAGIERAAKMADKWRDENKASAAKARKSVSDGARNMAEMLDGAAIECNAIAGAIRALTDTPDAG
jgi:hypothetical protein